MKLGKKFIVMDWEKKSKKNENSIGNYTHKICLAFSSFVIYLDFRFKSFKYLFELKKKIVTKCKNIITKKFSYIRYIIM